MTKGICRAVAISAALILTSSVTVQAVTVNIGTQGTVNTDSIQELAKGSREYRGRDSSIDGCRYRSCPL